MSIMDITRKSEPELDLEFTSNANAKVIYSAKIGFGSSKGGLMPKRGNDFLNPCEEDIKNLEYFVSKGLAEKTIVES